MLKLVSVFTVSGELLQKLRREKCGPYRQGKTLECSSEDGRRSCRCQFVSNGLSSSSAVAPPPRSSRAQLKWDLLWRCTSTQLGNPQQRQSSVNSPRRIRRQTRTAPHGYWCCSNKMKWLTSFSCSSSFSLSLGAASRKAAGVSTSLRQG